jgi:hypothetical protein
MKQAIISLFILLATTTTAFGQSTLKEDYSHELCKCLLNNAYEQYHLQAITDREEIITYIMDACYGFHFLHVRTYTSSVDAAIDLMHDPDVEKVYEDLAAGAVDIVMEKGK